MRTRTYPRTASHWTQREAEGERVGERERLYPLLSGCVQRQEEALLVAHPLCQTKGWSYLVRPLFPVTGRTHIVDHNNTFQILLWHRKTEADSRCPVTIREQQMWARWFQLCWVFPAAHIRITVHRETRSGPQVCVANGKALESIQFHEKRKRKQTNKKKESRRKEKKRMQRMSAAVEKQKTK